MANQIDVSSNNIETQEGAKLLVLSKIRGWNLLNLMKKVKFQTKQSLKVFIISV